MEIQILHKDDFILVVNKPAGLSVLAEGWDESVSYLVKMLEGQFSKIWTVHRIDKTTSGVLVFALTAEAHRSLSIQFEKHQVTKTYHAIMTGSPKWEEKTAKFPLRVNVGHKHRTVVDDRNGIRAETRFKVLKRNQESALIEAVPMTGRTHQIRVHAYALGHPLLGDSLYSAPETKRIGRPALHAYSLSFTHPAGREMVGFTAPYPPDFANALVDIK